LDISLNKVLAILGSWDLEKLKDCIPNQVRDKIAALAPPSSWKEPNHITWEPSQDGCFNLKSAQWTKFLILFGARNDQRESDPFFGWLFTMPFLPI